MDGFNEWLDGFKAWVRHEPVRAAERVRMLLFSTAALLQITTGQEELTAAVGVITALFSIYASKWSRDRVSPVSVTTGEFEENYRV